MSDIAIKVDNVSKTFNLPHEKTGSVKNAFTGLFSGKRTYEKQEVLKDISFEIKKGEFFGIVGKNGSGKSTLLKLMAGVYSPNSGDLVINGKLTPFIELGVGFNPELTGRENVFLNGALLGFSRPEMESMYDEIVEFAELNKFMDQKLKNYSSGMQIRLAFSIAIRAKSDILVLDEVLAVGDESFQRKCLDVFDHYKMNGQTIVLVTHDMATVTKYCSRAMLIDSGKIVKIGSPNKIAAEYSSLNQKDIDTDTATSNKTAQQTAKFKVELLNEENNEVTSFGHNDTMKIRLEWQANNVKNVGIAIQSGTGHLVLGANTMHMKNIKLRNEIIFEVKLNLLPGRYHVAAGIFGKTRYDIVDFNPEGPSFSIRRQNIEEELEGMTLLEHKWELTK